MKRIGHLISGVIPSVPFPNPLLCFGGNTLSGSTEVLLGLTIRGFVLGSIGQNQRRRSLLRNIFTLTIVSFFHLKETPFFKGLCYVKNPVDDYAQLRIEEESGFNLGWS
jgi:hypothetical protein